MQEKRANRHAHTRHMHTHVPGDKAHSAQAWRPKQWAWQMWGERKAEAMGVREQLNQAGAWCLTRMPSSLSCRHPNWASGAGTSWKAALCGQSTPWEASPEPLLGRGTNPQWPRMPAPSSPRKGEEHGLSTQDKQPGAWCHQVGHLELSCWQNELST